MSDSNSKFLTVVNLESFMNVIRYINTIINNFLTKIIDKKREPKVWQKCDRQGNIYWLTFDPITKIYSFFSSEEEVRIWLEERYYYH